MKQMRGNCVTSLRHGTCNGDEKSMWSCPLLVCCTIQNGLHFLPLFNDVTTAGYHDESGGQSVITLSPS